MHWVGTLGKEPGTLKCKISHCVLLHILGIKHTMKYGHTHKLSRVWRISSKETSWQNIFVQVVTDNKIIISFARESNINDNADGHSDDYMVIIVKLMMTVMVDMKKMEGVSDHLRDLLCLWPLSLPVLQPI